MPITDILLCASPAMYLAFFALERWISARPLRHERRWNGAGLVDHFSAVGTGQ